MGADTVRASGLTEDDISTVIVAMREVANPSGWYFSDNGITAGINKLRELLAESLPAEAANDDPHATNDYSEQAQATDTQATFNRRNLKNLISDGAIFYVEFIKRSTGDLRKMKCRAGVKKYLKGGSKAYSTKQHNLLTVFDMEAKGYRSIPVEAIQRLTVGGQTFNAMGV